MKVFNLIYEATLPQNSNDEVYLKENDKAFYK
jgi:hypothetical protein